MSWVENLVGMTVEKAVESAKNNGQERISVLTREQAARAGRPLPGTLQIIREENLVVSAGGFPLIWRQ